MIAAQKLNQPSAHVKRRARACKVKTLGFDSYLVTPPEQGKLKRLVHFDVSEVGVVKIECVAVETGEVCEANTYSQLCSHVQAAVLRLEQNIRKEEARQSQSQSTVDRSKRVSKAVKEHPSQKRLV